MPLYNSDSLHSYYTDTDRHFAPHSESYTGADSLITAQRQGWGLVNIAYEETIKLRGGRYTSLYHFKLVRGSEAMIMPVVANPFIERLLLRSKILVLPLRQKAKKKARKDNCEEVIIDVLLAKV